MCGLYRWEDPGGDTKPAGREPRVVVDKSKSDAGGLGKKGSMGERKIVGCELDRFTIGVVRRQVLLKEAVHTKGFETSKAGKFVIREAGSTDGVEKRKFVMESRGGEGPVPAEGNFLELLDDRTRVC
jgi:hypothetical protein